MVKNWTAEKVGELLDVTARQVRNILKTTGIVPAERVGHTGILSETQVREIKKYHLKHRKAGRPYSTKRAG